MFFVKGFATHKDAARYFGSAVAAITASDIAPTVAAAKLGGSNVELRTSVIDGLLKGGLTNGIVSRPIVDGWQQFPLWIKVPPSSLPLAISSRRRFSRRSSPKMATNKHMKPE